MKPHWTFVNYLFMIDGIAMAGKRAIMLEELQQQSLDQLHINHMGIEKTRLLPRISLY